MQAEMLPNGTGKDNTQPLDQVTKRSELAHGARVGLTGSHSHASPLKFVPFRKVPSGAVAGLAEPQRDLTRVAIWGCDTIGGCHNRKVKDFVCPD